MSNTWILVANSSCAKIFKSNSQADTLIEVADLLHSESKMHEQKVTSDLPGSHAGGGSSRHGFEGETGIKEHEAENFAKEIDAYLETARNNGQFKKLVIAAAPAFLGVLRNTISQNTAKLISHELDKDLVKLSATELLDHLPGRL